MSFRWTKLKIYLTGALLLVSLSLPALAGDKKDAKKDSGKQTLTGVVSDSMCGAHHMMENAADCTRACISKGSKYALVVGDKVYTLDSEDKTALDELNKRAGDKAKVTGTVNGDNIQVSSVSGT
ncbi:MAG TPA: hypothetical protein VEV41_26190 [Terriglobales bacterium]|jgi:hypothetical protein|nr:hypothetical protein [Terriglobales bacterium]